MSTSDRIDALTDTQTAVIQRWFREKREMSQMAHSHGVAVSLDVIWNDPNATGDDARRVFKEVSNDLLFLQILDVFDRDPNRS